MDIKTHLARILGPLPYQARVGHTQNIPVGPCLVEVVGNKSANIVWGARGQSSAAVNVQEIEAAQHSGLLELLD